MRFIAHRGNTDGKFESYENEPNYIDKAIEEGFDVEVDVWYLNGVFYLGHDEPQYGVTDDFFTKRINRLWVHCKNIEAVNYFKNHENLQYTHYFWHQEDDITLTSFNFLWTHPTISELGEDSICVMPEINDLKIPHNVHGICSDYIKKYRDDFTNIRNKTRIY